MRSIKENAKELWRNRVCALFVPGVMLGVAFSCSYGKKYAEYAGILSAYYLQRYHYAAPSREQLFFFLLRERGMKALVLCALSATAARTTAVRLFSFWTGFCAGTCFTMLGLKFGAGGLAFGALGLLPQYVFYVAAYFLLVTGADVSIWPSPAAGGRSALPGRTWFSGGLGIRTSAFVRMVLLFFAGLVLEAWINPPLIHMLVKIL